MDKSGKPGASKNPHDPAGHAYASGPQRRVFVSYASADAEIAQRACSALEAGGFPCWIAPRNVVPGTMYADGIVHAIDESTILVLILSEQAIASAHVGREIERAVSKRHPVVALRIDAAPLTPAFEYFLNQSQWIEGGGSDAAIAHLVNAVGQHLAPGTVAVNRLPQPTGAPGKAATPRRVWGIASVIVVMALSAAYLFVNKAWLHGHDASAGRTAETVIDKSIAVLPFTDMSEKKDQEYFADGMAEEIIDLLVKIPGLKVISRTSSFQFKGKTGDLRTIASQLGVAYVLEGSVRKSGDRLRVTAQLINSRDGTHLWSQAYDRDFSDVLKMQDEIAASLVRALQIEVTSGDLVSRPALHNAEAYTSFLQGRHAFERYDQQGFEQALSDYQRALDLDPTFVAAASGLAAAHYSLGVFGITPPAIAFERARHAAERALQLDPNFAAARGLLGSIYDVYDWDWPAADRELKLALALAPHDADILMFAGRHSLAMGRWDDALKLLNASLEVDPLNPTSYLLLHYVQERRGKLGDAEVAIRRTLEISPSFASAHYFLGIVQLFRNQREAALAEMLKEKDDGARLLGSAMAYFALGRKADSDAALAQLLKTYSDHHRLGIAEVYAFRGESEEAFKWLDRAYAQKDFVLYRIKGEPLLENLADDPRYKAFLKKMNLLE
jgi:TolB-like protein